MRVWFKGIAAMLGLEDAAERTVREVVEAAASRLAVVGLSQTEARAVPDPDCCVLKAVEGRELVLVPTGGSMRLDIMPGTHFHIAIASIRGFHRGETTILSRWIKDDDEGGPRRVGYRASLPTTLVHLQRRATHRVPVAFDLAPSARMFVADGNSPFCTAPILDVSESGLRLRVPQDLPLSFGEILDIEARFPSVIPSFRVTAQIVRIGESKAPEMLTLGLRLLDPPEELSQSIRALDIRRGRRPAA